MPVNSIQILPVSGRPNLARADFESLLQPLGVDLQSYPLVVAGLRGYYRGLGATPGNDRGLYDDAVILYAPGAELYRTFNGNTDPSGIRAGSGNGSRKGMAVLNPGVWPSYRFSVHGSKSHPHEAICQRAAEVTVTRDGSPPYQDRGWFGINIHRGGNYSTSSEGCQTVPPAQWDEFIETAQGTARRLFGDRWRERTLTYVLLDCAEGQGSRPAAGVTSSRRAQVEEFLGRVIRPTLQYMGAWSQPAERLLLGTALAESALSARVQTGKGPARGLFQMEMATHHDIWKNFLGYRPKLAQAVRSLQSIPPLAPENELKSNDRYACAMARCHYLRVPAAIPATAEVRDLAAYWKAHYNTAAGKGTVEHFMESWKHFMEG